MKTRQPRSSVGLACVWERNDARGMRLALITVLLVCSIGCRQTTAPPVPLLVTLESSRTTVSRGDTVTFTVNAAGNNLFGVVLDYGDSVAEQYAMGGALSARVTFRHAFGSTGSFTVRAVVTDAIAGEKEASVGIVVN